jgi:hypothetical protein
MVPMSPIEVELVAIVHLLIQPLQQGLVQYCSSNGLKYNPFLCLHIDTLQTVVRLLIGSAYLKYNDNDCSNCDDTCTDDKIAHLGHPKVFGVDVQVLTIVLSNAKLDDGIDLKVYYLRDWHGSGIP